MRSVRFYEFGDPADVLRLEDVPRPEPGAGQVLVRLRARSINPSDLLTVHGLYGSLPNLPATPGLEGMGEVAAVGDGVGHFRAGQRVIPLGVPGTWQEYLLAPESQLLPVPDAINDRTAAQFVVNPLTAWIMTVEELSLEPGEWLLQTAAPERRLAVTSELLRLMATQEIVPPVEAEYPLSEVLAAVAHAQRPGRSGKVLLIG